MPYIGVDEWLWFLLSPAYIVTITWTHSLLWCMAWQTVLYQDSIKPGRYEEYQSLIHSKLKINHLIQLFMHKLHCCDKHIQHSILPHRKCQTKWRRDSEDMSTCWWVHLNFSTNIWYRGKVQWWDTILFKLHTYNLSLTCRLFLN